MEVLPGSKEENHETKDLKANVKSFIEEEKGELIESEKDELKENKESGDEKKDDLSQENGELTNGKVEDEWMDILGSGHLKKRVLTPGAKDTRPQKSDVIQVKYVGRLDDGKEVENVELAEINLGDNEVIHGLDFALSLMDMGETAEVIVKSRFAFGDMGRTPDIPPGATITYVITLLDVNPEPLMCTVSCLDRLAIGLRKKERGNWWFTRNEFTLAINCYRRAAEYFDDTEFPDSPTEEQIRVLLDERLKTYNNLGAAQIKISSYQAALTSFGHVLAAQPNNVKALYRKGLILKEQGELQEAISIFQKTLSIEPNTKIQSVLQQCLVAQRRENTKQRDLYKKMMGNSEDTTTKKKSATKSTKSAYKWLVVASACAVAAAGIFVIKYTRI